MLGVLLTSLLAVPDGYKTGKTANDCTVHLGPKLASGISKVYVECDWPDLALSKLDQLVGDVGMHETVFRSISDSEVIAENSGILRVRQVHVNPGIADRELIQLHGRTEKGGAIQHWWRKDKDQSDLSGDNVLPDKCNGYWLLEANGEGTKLGYALQYEPGGSVPGFVISAFQSSGVLEFVSALGTYARTH